MDIPSWVLALGLLVFATLVEYIFDRPSKNAKSNAKITHVKASTPPNDTPYSQLARAAGNSTAGRNAWDGEIIGRTVSKNSSWHSTRQAVLKRDRYTCTNCGSTSNLTVDHKVPLSLGGSNLSSNLTTLCKDCHEYKDQRKIFDKPFDARDNYGSDHRLTAKVAALTSAISSGSRITIKYTDYRGRKTIRTISPRRLAKDKGRIYCISFCHLRNERRTFRISRIEL
jgi:5-methylcytosine-specific restriction endonuclease McrA